MRAQKITFLNAEYSNITAEKLLDSAMDDVEQRKKASMVFLNVDVVMKLEKDTYLKKIVQEADYVLADGMPLIWFSRWIGTPLPEKISGSDFVPCFCKHASERKKSVFLLGGAEGVAERAADNLKRQYPELKIAGTFAPPMGFEKNELQLKQTVEEIRKVAPDILIVCLGCPKQEKFVYENQERCQVPLAICAGATVDFLAGSVKRCPKWMSKCGLEWFYRFLKEPERLFRRYFVDDIQIIGVLWKYRKRK